MAVIKAQDMAPVAWDAIVASALKELSAFFRTTHD